MLPNPNIINNLSQMSYQMKNFNPAFFQQQAALNPINNFVASPNPQFILPNNMNINTNPPQQQYINNNKAAPADNPTTIETPAITAPSPQPEAAKNAIDSNQNSTTPAQISSN